MLFRNNTFTEEEKQQIIKQILEHEPTQWEIIESKELSDVIRRQFRLEEIVFCCPNCGFNSWKTCFYGSEEIYYLCSKCNYLIKNKENIPFQDDFMGDNIFDCKGFHKNELA